MLLERLSDIKQEFPCALELGAHHGDLARALKKNGLPFVVSADLSEKMVEKCDPPRLVIDEEFLPFRDGTFDLVISNLSFHWVNDLPGLLAETKRILKPGGLFLASLIGGNSLFELRTALMEGRALPHRWRQSAHFAYGRPADRKWPFAARGFRPARL